MVSVILPTLNEAENILPLIDRLAAALNGPRELIVVDDDSEDGTGSIAADYARRRPDAGVRVVRRREEPGLAPSLREGLRHCRGDVVVWMDCDLSMPPETVPALVERIAQGCDLAIGSRYLPGGSPKRPAAGSKDDRLGPWLSSALNRALSAWLPSSLTDYTSGFAAAKRQVLDAFPFSGRHGEYFVALAHSARMAGYRVVEVPYECRPRMNGRSKTAPHFWDYLRRGWRYAAVALRLRLAGRTS